MRHDGKKESFLEIPEYMIAHRRNFTAAIQYEMVEDRLSLQETEVGQSWHATCSQLKNDITVKSKSSRCNMKRQENVRTMRRSSNYDKFQNETNLQIEKEKKARTELAVHPNTIKRQKQQEMRRYQAETAKQIAEISKMKAAGKKSKEEMQAQVEALEEKITSLGRKQSARGGEHKDLGFEDWQKLGLNVISNIFGG